MDDGWLPYKYQNFMSNSCTDSDFYLLLVLFYPLIFTQLLVLHFQPLPETVALVEDIVVDYVTDMVGWIYYYAVLFFRRGFGGYIFLHKALHFVQFVFY